MNVTATLLGQIATFIILVLFIHKFMWDPVIQVLDDRKRRIADSLALTERAHHDLVLGQKKAVELIREARLSAAQIVAQAQNRAHEIEQNAEITAKAETERQLLAVRTGMEVEVSRAKEHLRQQVATLAIAGAERILRREINAQNHEEMLTHLATGL